MTINKIPVKKLVEFNRLTEKRQVSFAASLKVPQKPKLDDSSGGDYWIRSTSGLGKAFKYSDLKVIKEKIELLSNDFEETENNNTKTMYKRNLEILQNYSDFDFSKWHPSSSLKFLSKSKVPLIIENLPIQVLPHHIFSFEDDGKLNVGGIWFVVWLEEFRLSDLGTYSDALFRYISHLYSRDYIVDTKYCLIVDALTKNVVSYNQILEKKIPSLLESTAIKLNNFLR